MYFAKYGSGRDIIVGLHGWSGDHTTFAPLIEYLPKDTTFYSFDLPGSGKSTAPTKWEMNSFANEVITNILRLTDKGITLVGSCSGGLLSLFIAKYLNSRNQIERVKRLILIDPFAYLPWYFKVFVAPQMGKIGWYAYYTTFANPVGRLLTNLSLRNRRTEETDLTSSFAVVNHQATYRYLKLLAESGGAEQFGDLKLPIEIVYGENTFSAVKESVRRWRKILPQANCYVLKNAGHLPIEEATSELAAIVYKTSTP